MANQIIVIKSGQSKHANHPKQCNRSHHLNIPTLTRLKRKGASPRFAFSAFYNLFHHKQFIWVKYPYSTSGLPARPARCTFNQLFNTHPGSLPFSPASAARTLHLSEDQLPTVVATFHSANLCSRLQPNCKFFYVDLGLKKTCLLIPPEKMQVRLKSDTVKLGVPMDPVGTYVEPKDCNALITEPEVITINTRQFHEVKMGTFRGAVDPYISAFNESPNYVGRNLSPDVYSQIIGTNISIAPASAPANPVGVS